MVTKHAWRQEHTLYPDMRCVEVFPHHGFHLFKAIVVLEARKQGPFKKGKCNSPMFSTEQQLRLI